jgi:hypothetical protein
MTKKQKTEEVEETYFEETMEETLIKSSTSKRKIKSI